MIEDIVIVILLVWTALVLLASWQLSRRLAQLIEERRELRRWKRLAELYQKQHDRWN